MSADPNSPSHLWLGPTGGGTSLSGRTVLSPDRNDGRDTHPPVKPDIKTPVDREDGVKVGVSVFHLSPRKDLPPLGTPWRTVGHLSKTLIGLRDHNGLESRSGEATRGDTGQDSNWSIGLCGHTPTSSVTRVLEGPISPFRVPVQSGSVDPLDVVHLISTLPKETFSSSRNLSEPKLLVSSPQNRFRVSIHTERWLRSPSFYSENLEVPTTSPSGIVLLRGGTLPAPGLPPGSFGLVLGPLVQVLDGPVRSHTTHRSTVDPDPYPHVHTQSPPPSTSS